MREFQSRGNQVTGFSRRTVDITNLSQIEKELNAVHADVVLNAAAYNKVDVAENEPQVAYAVNSLAVRNLAVTCRQLDARLVHFSTDYVFDGALGRPYTEEDAPRPLGAYAVSKLAGEFYAQAYCDKALVLRVCGVFGPGGLKTAQGNFVESMIRMAAKGSPIRIVSDFIASPTFAPEIARVTADLIDREQTGVFHAGGGTPVSWYDWARMIFDAAKLEAELKPTNEREYRTPARRPKFSALANARLERVGVAGFPALSEQLRRYFEERAKLLA